MKLTKLATVLGLALTVAACSSTKTNTGENTGALDSGLNTGAATEMSAADAEAARLAELRAQNKIVYFDYDSNSIRAEYMDILAAHGKYLAANSNVKVRIDGHTDERGSPEYNIGLSERRAKSVANILMSHGVSPSQIETVSYGEERPADPGHSEESWAQNRRAELNY